METTRTRDGRYEVRWLNEHGIPCRGRWVEPPTAENLKNLEGQLDAEGGTLVFYEIGSLDPEWRWAFT